MEARRIELHNGVLMKYANAALLNILNGPAPYFYADLWEIALRSGVTKLYTDWPFDITIGSNVYKSSLSLVSSSRYKLKRGLEVDECDLTMNQSDADTVSGVSFAHAVANGLFDRAVVTKYRQFLTATEATSANIIDPSANTILLFLGEINDWTLTNTGTDFKIKSMLNLLNVYMPRRQYQPTCGFVFGDANCTKARAALAVNGAVTLATSNTTIKTDTTETDGYFNNGVIKFTSGNNIGVVRTVKSYQGGAFNLVAPFPNSIAVGDTFTATPGCNKNFAGAITSVTGAASVNSTVNTIYNTLKYASGYFTGGTITFTSGDNSGQSRSIRSWQIGVANVSSGFTATPAEGDSFVITATSANLNGSCSGYENTAHFGGFPFIPVPETSY